jgi:hypothetical protein
MGASILSIIIFILFWDGKMQKLSDQGGIGILINSAIMIAVPILW